jgi:hypothetical protein
VARRRTSPCGPDAKTTTVSEAGSSETELSSPFGRGWAAKSAFRAVTLIVEDEVLVAVTLGRLSAAHPRFRLPRRTRFGDVGNP